MTEQPTSNGQSASKESYLKKLALPKGQSNGPIPIERALTRAHELRRFEIDNYWKRSNYVWLFQAAAITLTGLIYSKSQSDALLLLSAGLGAVTAQVGWLTARGSKFWQSNWEAHVDFLEPYLEGKLTQIVLHQKDGTRSSVSKVNERLYALLLIAWVGVFCLVAARLVLGDLPVVPPPATAAIGVVLMSGAMLFVLFRSRSSLNPSLNEEPGLWSRFRTPASKGELTIFDRSEAK